MNFAPLPRNHPVYLLRQIHFGKLTFSSRKSNTAHRQGCPWPCSIQDNVSDHVLSTVLKTSQGFRNRASHRRTWRTRRRSCQPRRRLRPVSSSPDAAVPLCLRNRRRPCDFSTWKNTGLLSLQGAEFLPKLSV